MCGICGIFDLNLGPLAHRERLDLMSARLKHRGPDSHGKFELPHLAMAIRRLSVIDLETGDQPLSNEDGDITLVFNGEIYNYRELRSELLARGHRLKTKADGEVMAHLYEEKGPDFVRELNGMFAVALWDEHRKRLVLARDRAGEKPLYYWQHDHTLVFGSEIKALFEYPGLSRELDSDAVVQYFFYGYVPGPRSIFAGIKKLPAAHRMVIEQGRICLEPYWRLQEYLPSSSAGTLRREAEAELVRELREHLRQAAISRLVSDVPLGVFLSGGIDSSTVVAIMSELSPGNVETFSVAFPQKSFNEEPYAERVARHFGTRHHAITADEPSLRAGLETIALHLDEPLADPAVIPTYLMSRFARQSIKVALSGEGSDELFGGYPTYIGAWLSDYYLRLPRLLRRQVFDRLQPLLPSSPGAVPLGMFLRRFLAQAERDPAERHAIWFGVFSPEQIGSLFAPAWTGSAYVREGVFGPVHNVLNGAPADDALARLLYLDFRLYLEDDLLVKVDRASMACSLELRTPFLDHRLIEFAAGLPGRLKVRRFQLKYILKKAVEPWLPREIVYRQKRGFSVPIAAWMRNELGPLLDETLNEHRLRRQGIFNPVFVRQLIREHQTGADHRKTLWALLCFQLWYDRWGPGEAV